MESDDLRVTLGHSSYRSDLQKNQKANSLQRQKNEIVLECFCRIGMKLRLRQKKLS